MIGEGGAVFVQDVGARLLHFPVDLNAGGLNDKAHGLGDLRTDAVPRYKSDGMPHSTASFPCFLKWSTSPPSARILTMAGGSGANFNSIPLVRFSMTPPAKSTSSSSPASTLSVSQTSTGRPTLIALRKKIRAKDLAKTALTPAILIIRGACSRLDPRPKLRPPTTKSPGDILAAKSGSASSRTCFASSGRLVRR